MENRIDRIITLSNNDKYMILDQGNYNNKSYYFVSKLNENDDLTDEFEILENDNDNVSSIEDETLYEALREYFKKRLEK